MRTHKEIVKFEVDVPDGYQAVAYRKGNYGEHFLGGEGRVWPVNAQQTVNEHVIVEKLPE